MSFASLLCLPQCPWETSHLVFAFPNTHLCTLQELLTSVSSWGLDQGPRGGLESILSEMSGATGWGGGPDFYLSHQEVQALTAPSCLHRWAPQTQRYCPFPQGRSVCGMGEVTLGPSVLAAVEDTDQRLTGCWYPSPGKGVLCYLSLYLLNNPGSALAGWPGCPLGGVGTLLSS